MKKIALATVIASVLAAPALANPIADRFGIDAGDYTAAELVRLAAAAEANDQKTVDFILSGDINTQAPSDRGLDVLAQHAAENDEQFRSDFYSRGGAMTGASMGLPGEAAREVAAEHAAQDDNSFLAGFLSN